MSPNDQQSDRFAAGPSSVVDVAGRSPGRFAYLLHRADAVLANPPGTVPAHRQAVNLGRDEEAPCLLLSDLTVAFPAAARLCGDVVLAGMPPGGDGALAAELAALRAGLRLARSRGAVRVGLSPTACAVSAGGLDLLREDVPISAGLAMRGAALAAVLDGAMDRLARRWAPQTGAVLGASTPPGRVAAALLAERTRRLVLIGDPPVGEVQGRGALLAVAAEACLRLAMGHGNGPLAARVRDLLGATPVLSALALTPVVERLVQAGHIVLTTDRDRLYDATVAVVAGPSAGRRLQPAQLRPAAVICDANATNGIPRELTLERPDLLVLDAGGFELPHGEAPPGLLGSRGLPPSLVEALVLAQTGHIDHTGVGGRLEQEEFARLARAATDLGFRASPITSYGLRIAQDRWAAMRKVRTFPGRR